MRRLLLPYDSIAAGRPTEIDLHGTTPFGNRLLMKDFAFSADERKAFGLRGCCPTGRLARAPLAWAP